MPWLCPRPEKLLPLMMNAASTLADSCLSRYCETSSSTTPVRCWVAPGGVCTWTKKYPWSSFGTNAVGNFTNSSPTAATIAR